MRAVGGGPAANDAPGANDANSDLVPTKLPELLVPLVLMELLVLTKPTAGLVLLLPPPQTCSKPTPCSDAFSPFTFAFAQLPWSCSHHFLCLQPTNICCFFAFSHTENFTSSPPGPALIA